jgi:chaperonin GroES
MYLILMLNHSLLENIFNSLHIRPNLPHSFSSTGISRSNSLRVHAVLTADVGKTLDVSKMAPLGDRLLVKPQEKESKSAGGILLTATSNNSIGEDSFVGTILAVGDEVELEGVKVGDRVLFSKYGSSNIEVPGGEVCFVQQRSVMAKLS